MGRSDLIGSGESCLVPVESRREKEIMRRDALKSKGRASSPVHPVDPAAASP